MLTTSSGRSPIRRQKPLDRLIELLFSGTLNTRENFGVFGVLDYFGYFFVYSFAGFLLETVFAVAVQGELAARKCFLILPLCPVYGLGAVAILLLTGPFRHSLPAVFLIGMAAASAVEYAMDFLYRDAIGVAFWDYTKMPLNVNGRICLLFSLIWGLLSVFLVRFIHPEVARVIEAAPRWLLLTALIFFLADAAASTAVLIRWQSKEALILFSHRK